MAYTQLINNVTNRIIHDADAELPEGANRQEWDIDWTYISDELTSYINALDDNTINTIIHEYNMNNVQRVYQSYDKSIEGQTMRQMVYQITIGRVERIVYEIDVTNYNDEDEPI